MSISGVGIGNTPAVQSMLNLQNQLDQLVPLIIVVL